MNHITSPVIVSHRGRYAYGYYHILGWRVIGCTPRPVTRGHHVTVGIVVIVKIVLLLLLLVVTRRIRRSHHFTLYRSKLNWKC